MNVSDKRNLAEQVEKNKQDILRHFQRDEVLADFGIRIIGQVESPSELPESAEEYGDAYAVGTQSPFNYYIWTRANNLSPVDYWFDFGEIAIAGPQGPKGDRGPQGETGKSTRWYLYSDAQWNYPAGKQPGDMALTYPSGNVYIVGDNGLWEGQTNIRGPQGPAGKNGRDGAQGEPGPQGPKGETGDAGGFINIAGILDTVDELPRPSIIKNLTVAYLVGPNKDLYIQVGSNSANASWLNVGPINAATLVSSGGQYQNTWNADTKLDKVSRTTDNNQAYVKSYNGSQSMVDISQTPSNWKIASYNGEGNLKTNYPLVGYDCINKDYGDNTYGPIAVPVEDAVIPWDDGDDFSVLESYYYTIHTFAYYTYQGETHVINFRPVSMYMGYESMAVADVCYRPGVEDHPGFTDEMLSQIKIEYHYDSYNPETCAYWLVEPNAGYPDEVPNLNITIIVERLY